MRIPCQTFLGSAIESAFAQIAALPQTIVSTGADMIEAARTLGAIAGISPFQTPAEFRDPSGLLLTGPVGARVNFGGERYLYFGGTNYLGLAGHPLIRLGSALAALRYGSTAASRATSGTSALHLLAEKKIAEFMGTEDACLMVSGLHANCALMEVLGPHYDVIFRESSVHASVDSAIRASFSDIRTFDQKNLAGLKAALRGVKNGRGSAVVAMNGVDPMSGRIAPLDKILSILPDGDFGIFIDDCHAVGILGANGRGTPEYLGVSSGSIYQSATMSKAFGGHGGVVAGSRELCDKLRATRSYITSTSLPPAGCAADLIAVGLVMRNPSLRRRALSNAEYATKRLLASEFSVTHHGTPILLMLDLSGKDADSASARLRQAGIIVPSMGYDSTSRRLRIAISAAHTKADIDELCRALRSCA